jgi:murein DD-endopeptidase MepM/ murein hydrolase activator NlpD
VVFDPFPDGLDLYARTGTPVVAAASGTVAHTDDASGHVAIVAADGQTLTEYGHMSVPLELRVGDQVQAGDGVGAIDNTATNGGPPHLHFKLQTAGGPVDPLPWLLAGRLPLEEPPAGS